MRVGISQIIGGLLILCERRLLLAALQAVAVVVAGVRAAELVIVVAVSENLFLEPAIVVVRYRTAIVSIVAAAAIAAIAAAVDAGINLTLLVSL